MYPSLEMPRDSSRQGFKGNSDNSIDKMNQMGKRKYKGNMEGETV